MTIDENDLNEMLNGGDEDKIPGEKCPLDRTSVPSFMLDILKAKSTALADSLKLGSDLFKIVVDDLDKKKDVYGFIKRIMTETQDTIDQFDYLTALVENDDSDDDEKE